LLLLGVFFDAAELGDILVVGDDGDDIEEEDDVGMS
jgi:hypothetical protein